MLTPDQMRGRAWVDLITKRANMERLARKAAHGNDAAQRLLPKARRLFQEARTRYESEYGPWQ